MLLSIQTRTFCENPFEDLFQAEVEHAYKVLRAGRWRYTPSGREQVLSSYSRSDIQPCHNDTASDIPS